MLDMLKLGLELNLQYFKKFHKEMSTVHAYIYSIVNHKSGSRAREMPTLYTTLHEKICTGTRKWNEFDIRS